MRHSVKNCKENRPTRSKSTDPLGQRVPTHSVKENRPTRSKSTDPLGQRVPTHSVKEYRPTRSKSTDPLGHYTKHTQCLPLARATVHKWLHHKRREAPCPVRVSKRRPCANTGTLLAHVRVHRGLCWHWGLFLDGGSSLCAVFCILGSLFYAALPARHRVDASLFAHAAWAIIPRNVELGADHVLELIKLNRT
jgi:hypothetical protein